MWIFDLAAALGSILIVAIASLIAYRRYYKLMHPAPTLQEQIQYYENLNTELDK